jgi:protein-S-isoprenylcysteine O-methyltransferase Ste14
MESWMPLHTIVHRLLVTAWVTFFLYWLIAAFFASRAVKRESPARRALTLLLGSIPFFLMFTGDLRYGLLARRFVPDVRSVAVAGAVVTYAGLALAIWARVILGRNWSAAVTIKHEHRLIRSGPYAVVRHPIYSGLLLALLGTGLDVGEVRALAAVAIAFLVWHFKSRTEERFMVEQFGREYEEYRRRTRALVPFVL